MMMMVTLASRPLLILHPTQKVQLHIWGKKQKKRVSLLLSAWMIVMDLAARQEGHMSRRRWRLVRDTWCTMVPNGKRHTFVNIPFKWWLIICTGPSHHCHPRYRQSPLCNCRLMIIIFAFILLMRGAHRQILDPNVCLPTCLTMFSKCYSNTHLYLIIIFLSIILLVFFVAVSLFGLTLIAVRYGTTNIP